MSRLPACPSRYNRGDGSKKKPAAMMTVDLEPLTVTVPLREDPPGMLRAGDRRTLLKTAVGNACLRY
jgi:hypothetical protein